MKIVEITWVDSAGMCGIWETPDCEPLTPMKIKSVGYLWEKTKDYVTIIQSIGNEQLGRRFSIPRGCIKKIKKL
jgi:hypothetical protein